MTEEWTSPPPWSDESLSKTDIAGRSEFAKAVAARIDSCADGQGSTVFGLVGSWGSGKTTLLKDIVGQLDDWKSVWFSPWSVADVGSITAEFVSALSEAFPKSPSVKDRLASYSRFGTPVLKMIPVVGDVMASVTTEAITALTKRPAWHSEFGALSEEIAGQHHRVLVIVDDVDRLDGDELRSLLRVVRLLGRFVNVHYLMAYDQATIETVLASAGAKGESSDFMEKIVQYPFEVPPTPMVVRRRWSRQILDEVSPADETIAGLHAEHREELVRILASGLETPRAAERLREQMLSLSGLVADAEVDAFDFTALTWLRIAHHQVWDEIRRKSDEYLSWRESDSVETHQRRMERVESLVVRGHAKPVQDAVSYLFEPMGVMGALAGRQGRMQKARYFDRYFQVGLADDDVSERKTQNALRELSNGIGGTPEIAALKAIILGQDVERSALALEVAGNLRSASLTTSLAILDYVEDICSNLKLSGKLHPFRLSTAERWLAKEIFLALDTKLMSAGKVIARFGYQFLTDSAYAIKRSGGHDHAQIKNLYADVARHWVAEVRYEPLASTLVRPELILMTSFCVWIRDLEDHIGFLSERIVDGRKLIDAATGYVSFDEWVGADVTYDVVFREQEFRFAVGEALRESVLAEISPVGGVPDYAVSDLASREQTEAQRRDFAIRSVLALDTREPPG
ncbi:P-loop NTPase fold protein [Pseudarthrobacter sp. IC2-21]|uniref:KAP family P-loop NTPase fold protein n=1 Tax=Pseudarthrobacter sp. IC2-21 TaxID=3092262 RepID=UPI002A6A7361|nr:P-loop NTPase fold protein [Pseudarthrobacter sp. IC2-21]